MRWGQKWADLAREDGVGRECFREAVTKGCWGVRWCWELCPTRTREWAVEFRLGGYGEFVWSCEEDRRPTAGF